MDNPTGFILTDRLRRLLQSHTRLARSSRLYIDYLSYDFRPSFWIYINRIKQWIIQQVYTDLRNYYKKIILLSFLGSPQQSALFPHDNEGNPDLGNQQLFLKLSELSYAKASMISQWQACETGSSWRLQSGSRQYSWEPLPSARPGIYYSMLPLPEDQPCLQLLGL